MRGGYWKRLSPCFRRWIRRACSAYSERSSKGCSSGYFLICRDTLSFLVAQLFWFFCALPRNSSFFKRQTFGKLDLPFPTLVRSNLSPPSFFQKNRGVPFLSFELLPLLFRDRGPKKFPSSQLFLLSRSSALPFPVVLNKPAFISKPSFFFQLKGGK